MKSNIPANRTWAKLGDVFTFSGGGTPSKQVARFWNGDIYWASVKDVKGKLLFKTQDTITQEGFEDSATQLAEPNEVLMITRMAPGRPIITQVKTAINQDLKIVRPKIDIPSLFTYYWFLALEKDFLGIASGTTVQGIRIQDVNEITFPLPPLAEQRRIVAKLDATMRRVETSRARLEKLPGLLKQFRQAMLAAAVSGRLTEAWRTETSTQETASVSHQTQERAFETATLSEEEDEKCPALPEGWKYVRLGDYAENLDNQRVPIASNLRASTQGQYPYYGASGVIDTIDKFTHDGEFVLIGEDGANLLTRSKPIAFLATGKIWVNNHAHVLRCYEGYPNDYLSFYINSIDLTPFVTGSAQPKLAQKNMNRILIPVPSAAEQQEIVRQVNHYFGLADQLESRFELAAGIVEQLPQALLAKAFSGQLVPQDPTDEPASELLTRTKAAADKFPAKAVRKERIKADDVPGIKQSSSKMKSKPVKTLPEFVERLSQLGGKAQPQQLLIEFDLQQDIDSFFDLLREGKSKGKLKVPTGEAGLIELTDDAN